MSKNVFIVLLMLKESNIYNQLWNEINSTFTFRKHRMSVKWQARHSFRIEQATPIK